MKLFDIPELESVCQNERTNKINLLHKFFFDAEGCRSNRKRIRKFSGFGYRNDITDLKKNVDVIKDEFSFYSHFVIYSGESLTKKPYDNYLLKNNLLYKGHKGPDIIVLPDKIQLNGIKHVDEKKHFGCKPCHELLNEAFLVPNMSCKIDKIIAKCVTRVLYIQKSGKQECQFYPLHKKTNLPYRSFSHIRKD